ncbi:MAG: hypothetical protein CL758_07015 [Chloroflexi bacterium]|nr:hypothetical protein [Chloroflexota bacterium]|tara:strand:- start:19901 stop:20500 length:600 start_codon:yes stop_codon:yes gene_type:complete
MRNHLYTITFITFLSLIGCNGVVGQGTVTAQIKESSLDFMISDSLEKEVNGMNEQLKNEFNQLISDGKDLVKEIEILEKEINDAKIRAENLENLNNKMTTKSEDTQKEIDLLINSNKDFILQFDQINIELDQTAKLINLTQKNIVDLEQKNENLNIELGKLLNNNEQLLKLLKYKEAEIQSLLAQLNQSSPVIIAPKPK